MKDDITPKKSQQSIDSLNEKLYHKNVEFDNKDRRHMHGKRVELEHDFDDSELEELLKKKPRKKLPKSLFKKFFIAAAIFFVAAGTVAIFSVIGSTTSVSKDLISMEILAQPLVDGGEQLELQVRIQNFNEQMLELPDLILSYEKDSYIAGNEVFLRRSLEDIPQNGRISEEFNIVLFGQEGDIRNVNATLEYRIEGSSSIFVKEQKHEVVIRSTPTKLAIQAPDRMTKNQEITFDFQVASNSIDQVSNGLLVVEYPEGFEFLSSNVEPSYSNDIWEIKTLDEIGEVISVSGRLSALEGQGQTVKAFFGKQNITAKKELETIFNTTLHTVTVEKPFLETVLKINNKTDSVVPVRSGGSIEGQIEFTNTLQERLQDITITLNLEGVLYDKKSVLSFSGFYDSNTDTINWNNTLEDELSFLEPNEMSELSFNLSIPDLINLENVIDPTLIMSVDVGATQNDGTVLFAQTVARTEARANSDIQVVAKTIHHSGAFGNIGPVPPKVGENTQYTITLDLINSSNLVENARLVTTLPEYVTWMGAVSPSSERSSVSYNPTDREVVWVIDDLQQGLGIGDKEPKKLSFQVSILPSLSHLGNAPDITGEITLTGTDSFTDTNLTFTKRALTTRLLNDTSDVGASGKVEE